MHLLTLAELSARIAATKKRNDKLALIAACLKDAEPDQRGLLALYLSGALRQAKLGVGYAQVAGMRAVAPAETATIILAEVDAALAEIATLKGAGSGARRLALLHGLFGSATAVEQTFLCRLILGELRQGALESLLLDAVARAAEVPAPLVRRAQMLAGDLANVVETAFTEGEAGLAGFDLTLFRPVQPMLAEPASDIEAALAKLGRMALEWKLDGARVQVHRRGDEVRVYTRALNEVTDAVPEVIAAARALPASELVLDGEVIALRPDGTPLPFQETMRRFGRRTGVDDLRAELPLTTFFFDCMLRDGESLLNATTVRRAEVLAELVPDAERVPRIVTADLAEARAFVETALETGHEGVMAKALDAPYAAGSRGASWLKVKQAHTLDLVVLAAEWGSGRRTGTLSNLHLGARDPDGGGFVMLGKTFKGLTDALLKWQTDELLAREVRRDDYTVYVRPELVVEIAFNDVQVSPHYPGGVALRFARVKRYRDDKGAGEADTIAQVRAFLPNETVASSR
ncbi:MAG: ATP-dependent DNA ligase [Polyangiales bacterium]